MRFISLGITTNNTITNNNFEIDLTAQNLIVELVRNTKIEGFCFNSILQWWLMVEQAYYCDEVYEFMYE